MTLTVTNVALGDGRLDVGVARRDGERLRGRRPRRCRRRDLVAQPRRGRSRRRSRRSTPPGAAGPPGPRPGAVGRPATASGVPGDGRLVSGGTIRPTRGPTSSTSCASTRTVRPGRTRTPDARDSVSVCLDRPCGFCDLSRPRAKNGGGGLTTAAVCVSRRSGPTSGRRRAVGPGQGFALRRVKLVKVMPSSSITL